MSPEKKRLKLTVEDCNCELITNELEERTAELEHEKIEAEIVLHSLGEAMFVVDKDHIVRMMNPYAADLLGYKKPEDAVGKMLDEAVPALDEKGNPVPLSERSNFRAFGGTTKIASTSSFFVRTNGEKFPVQATTTAISIDDERMGAITVFRDITREHKIERAKSEFISLAAHQLRTPISVVMLNAELMAKHFASMSERIPQEDMTEISKSLSDVSAAAHSAAELINTLLNLSKIEMGIMAVDKRPLPLRKFIDEEVERIAPIATLKKESFSIEFDEDVPEEITTDKTLLQIIVQNILSNAVKYNKDGGVVTIQAKKSKGCIRICISDQGIGVPQNAQHDIFKKFYRADNVVGSEMGGAGLGLYLVATAVKELDGILWMESEENKGTSFYFEIPIA